MLTRLCMPTCGVPVFAPDCSNLTMIARSCEMRISTISSFSSCRRLVIAAMLENESFSRLKITLLLALSLSTITRCCYSYGVTMCYEQNSRFTCCAAHASTPNCPPVPKSTANSRLTAHLWRRRTFASLPMFPATTKRLGHRMLTMNSTLGRRWSIIDAIKFNSQRRERRVWLTRSNDSHRIFNCHHPRPMQRFETSRMHFGLLCHLAPKLNANWLTCLPKPAPEMVSIRRATRCRCPRLCLL